MVAAAEWFGRLAWFSTTKVSSRLKWPVRSDYPIWKSFGDNIDAFHFFFLQFLKKLTISTFQESVREKSMSFGKSDALKVPLSKDLHFIIVPWGFLLKTTVARVGDRASDYYLAHSQVLNLIKLEKL